MLTGTLTDTGIETGKTLEYHNLVSVRKKLSVEEVQPKIMEVARFLKESGLQPKGPMISTTFNVEIKDGQQVLDSEFLFPVDREIHDLPDDYEFKPVFRLVNAVYKHHDDTPEKLQDSYQELLTYIEIHLLQKITSRY